MSPGRPTPGTYWITASRSDREHLESLGVELLREAEEKDGIVTYIAKVSPIGLRRLAPHWHRYYWGKEEKET